MSNSSFGPFGEQPDDSTAGGGPHLDRRPVDTYSQAGPEDAYAPPSAQAVDAELLAEKPVGFVVAAWTVIVVVCAGMFYLQSDRARNTKQEQTSSSSFTLRMLEIQGKYIVAVSGSPGMDREKAYESAQQINQGPIDVRIRFVVLAGELAGVEEALAKLGELQRLIEQHGKKPNETQQKIMGLLKSLYGDYEQSKWEGPSLTASDRKLLKDKLGWFGSLALGPDRGESDTASQSAERKEALSAAQRVMIVLLVCTMLGLGIGAAGLVGGVLFAIFTSMGKVRSSLETGSRFGGVYAESFAVWLVVWVGLSLAAALIRFEVDRLLLGGIVSLTTLVALLWPLMRGTGGRQLAKDIGLIVPGRRVWLEPFWGVVCYVSSLPILALGFLMTWVLMTVFGGAGGGDEFSTPNTPSHPIVESIGDGAWLVWLKMFLVAAVVAPIVEEIMFRGVLYRHLRDATAKHRIAVSVLISGGISSFVFAIIHPQGIYGVPVLMSLAFAFCLAREWRGSIVAPITMHAINNGSVTVMLLILLSL